MRAIGWSINIYLHNKGETTSVIPREITAGSWYVIDLPLPVGINTKQSLRAKTSLIISSCIFLNSLILNSKILIRVIYSKDLNEVRTHYPSVLVTHLRLKIHFALVLKVLWRNSWGVLYLVSFFSLQGLGPRGEPWSSYRPQSQIRSHQAYIIIQKNPYTEPLKYYHRESTQRNDAGSCGWGV